MHQATWRRGGLALSLALLTLSAAPSRAAGGGERRTFADRVEGLLRDVQPAIGALHGVSTLPWEKAQPLLDAFTAASTRAAIDHGFFRPHQDSWQSFGETFEFDGQAYASALDQELGIDAARIEQFLEVHVARAITRAVSTLHRAPLLECYGAERTAQANGRSGAAALRFAQYLHKSKSLREFAMSYAEAEPYAPSRVIVGFRMNGDDVLFQRRERIDAAARARSDRHLGYRPEGAVRKRR